MLARLRQQRVEEGEIELASSRLDLLPGDRALRRVLAWSRSITGQTLGSIAGQLLELFTCAPSIRNGAPSTISAWWPSRLSICGSGVSAAAIGAAAVRSSAPSSPMRGPIRVMRTLQPDTPGLPHGVTFSRCALARAFLEMTDW